MSRHTRALKTAERDLAKRKAELDELLARRETLHQTTGTGEESEADESDSMQDQEELDAAILTAQSVVKKAKSKVAEAEMFVMRNRY